MRLRVAFFVFVVSACSELRKAEPERPVVEADPSEPSGDAGGPDRETIPSIDAGARLPGPLRAKAIVSGGVSTCAIDEGDFVHCWGGRDETGRPSTAMPTGLRAKSVAVGLFFNCAIRLDDTIACWGQNGRRQLDAPAGTFTAIAAGTSYACAIRRDRTIACWGEERPQLDAPRGEFVKISVADHHGCALSVAGTMECWGDEFLGWGLVEVTPLVLEGSFVDLAVAVTANCGIRPDDTVVCANDEGILPTTGRPAAALFAGHRHICTLDAWQEVSCWGDNEFGETKRAGVFASLSAGYFFTCGIDLEGKISCWGRPNDESLDVPPELKRGR